MRDIRLRSSLLQNIYLSHDFESFYELEKPKEEVMKSA